MEQQSKLTNLIEIVRQIRFRPVMYIGDKKISSMYMFLNGYRFAIMIHKLEADQPVTMAFQDFNDFIALKLGKNSITHGWRAMMIEHCDGNEEKALEFFFETFEEFIEHIHKKFK